jgi:RNA polymerase sigma-70 factor (ECF subfamily)
VPNDLAARIATAGRAAWPQVTVTDDVIEKHVADRSEEDAGLPEHDADVYLAIALAGGNTEALRIFEDKLVPQIDQALRRLRLPAVTKDEVRQTVRMDLLVGDGSPKIADYAGRGELVGWLRVTATRKALSLLRKTNREESLDDVLLDHWPDTGGDPSEQHLRAKYAAELKRAIHQAFADLEVRQRNLLRQHILDELTIDDLARLYRAHRATCARWVADAREELGKNTRKRLVAALGIDRDDVSSLLRFLDTDLELSISRMLKDKTNP